MDIQTKYNIGDLVAYKATIDFEYRSPSRDGYETKKETRRGFGIVSAIGFDGDEPFYKIDNADYKIKESEIQCRFMKEVPA